MSCRVLGRRIEEVFLSESIQILRNEWDVSTWQAEYKVTAKNEQVRDFYEKFGFEVTLDLGDRKSYLAEDNMLNAVRLDFITIR